ncbi:MAG TPA: hypothetical protein VFU55_13210 [Terracidiphilus sp.]|nr:hypothetical protein [Terracidiphilus sp.]
MTLTRLRMILVLGAMAAGMLQVHAQSAQTRYLKMAPLGEYLMANRSAEIALARSAAPESISGKAEVMVLEKSGFKVAVPGTNHFVCLVERGWNAAIGDPVFWNPKARGPICFNAAAARSNLPIVLFKTRLALAGKSQAQITKALQTAFDEKKLPQMEPGAMCYMLSKDGYLNDRVGNWHPHLMFFVPLAMSKAWGANLPGSPILSGDDVTSQLTIFMIPVARWSDGTPDSHAGH